MPTPNASTQADKAALEVDGARVNILSARGGSLRAVPTPSRVAYGPVEINAALEEVFSSSFGHWFRNAIDGDTLAKTVHVTMVRLDNDAVPIVAHGYTLERARIVRLKVPALDRRQEARAPVYFALKPEKIEFDPNAPGDLVTTIPQIRWNRSDFQLDLGGLPCEEVIQVSPLAWRSQKGVENLKLAIGRTDATERAWYEWFDRAARADDGARDGKLVLANPERKKEWVRILLSGVQIVRFVPRYDTGTHFLVELSVKRIRFSPS